ncbi:hypothetical protein MUN84_17795 [Hymenobacter sp. 5516J-16]|uniref:hypothetical protein n=1 Tax=Hymenobacter sp. 5516J-16 TaxID=2932253 RepID=UPI001FD04739|nr:hypothetical protein [Hymenobacter sp. 5516J-16]UOQ76389.1 hypothetical protein MUN84_17795 [Hymenobacter sp. 5516J-16]
MLVTCFGIYRQFQGFGIFHVAALLSFLTLVAGMVPVLRRQPARSWQQLHFSFMYASVLELYVALAAEMLVRVPGLAFWEVVGLSVATVVLPGAALFWRFRPGWHRVEAPREPQVARIAPSRGSVGPGAGKQGTVCQAERYVLP